MADREPRGNVIVGFASDRAVENPHRATVIAPIMIQEPPIFPRYRDDSIPAFRLNAIRRRYRRKLWRELDSGAIELEAVTSCPCGGDRFRKIAEKDRFGFPFGTYLCLRCGLLVLSPRIAERSLPRYYREFYHPLVLGTAPGETLPELVKKGQGEGIFRFLKDSLNRPSGRPFRICEVGCASGSNLLSLKRGLEADGVSCELYGTEFEENYAKVAASQGIRVKSEGMETLSGFGVQFDLIVLSHLFEHLSDPPAALRLLEPLLCSGGRLFIEVPGLRNLKGYGYDLLDYLVHAHLFHYDLASLKGLVERNGFSMIKGDETVRGVFAIGPSKPVPEGAAGAMLDYLIRLESDSPPRRMGLRRLVRPIWESYHKLERACLPRSNKLRGPL